MDDILVRLLVVVAIVALAAIVGRWWTRRSGRLRSDGRTLLDAGSLEAVGLDLSDVDAGVVLIGSETCAPCEQAMQVIDDAQREHGGFRWVYADANEHLPFTRRHGILRIPTVLVVSSDGRVVARTSGVPRADELAKAVADAA